jgi:hypothetical protein
MWSFSVAALALIPGCPQQLGDRCQINEDCASGYCALFGASRAQGGTCQIQGTSMPDLSMPPGLDMTLPTDMAHLPDMTHPLDMGMLDN